MCEIKVKTHDFGELLNIFEVKIFPFWFELHLRGGVLNVADGFFLEECGNVSDMVGLDDSLGVELMKVKVEYYNILFL